LQISGLEVQNVKGKNEAGIDKLQADAHELLAQDR
jgi:hypothetical protein